MKIFIHDIEIFDLQLLVCIGAKRKDVLKWAKKNSKATEKMFQNKEMDDWDDCTETSAGFVRTFNNGNVEIFYLLYLEKWENHWKWVNILNHEVVHLRQFLFKDKNIKDEIEFEAYFQESAFDKLRRKLNNIFKI